MKRSATALIALVAALLCAYGGSARASSQSGDPMGSPLVLASESVLLQESGAMTTSLSIPGPGKLFVTLTDLQFPTSFSSLEYFVSNSSGPLVGPVSAGSQMPPTLDLTAPTTLYVNVFAAVTGNSAGLFNLTATFYSAVPLPGSIGLFATAAALIGLLRGSRRRGIPVPG
jgi:hypothetical protein